MKLSLNSQTEQFIQDRVKAGDYSTPEDVIYAGLEQLKQDRGAEFSPGEIEALIAEGQRDIDRGDVFDGREVFDEIRQMSANRRAKKG